MNTVELDRLTERLMGWEERLPWAAEIGPVAAAAIGELAVGEPVEVASLAARVGLPAGAVVDLLRRSPAEFDDHGRLVGFGLTLRPTAHRFELGGRTLYTWCAPDALAFPIVLGTSARVESPCLATGEIVRIEVDPDGVCAVDPGGAVVSIITPDVGMSDFRRRLCHEQHFFSSAAAAAPWQAERPAAIVVSVRDAFALARALVARWLGSEVASDETHDGFERALAAIGSCALDGVGRRDQKDRYARLAASVALVRREPEAVVIEFDQHFDRQMLEAALAVERQCCPFFRFAFDHHHQLLRVTVADVAMLPALDAIAIGFETTQPHLSG